VTGRAPVVGLPSGMPSAIEVRSLSKRFGAVHAVDDLSFEVAEGRVTGFLGPNGSGKTTTLRMLLGLVSITEGSATIGGKRYVDLDHPIRHVGAALEATSFHPSRRAEDHLKTVALAGGVPLRRVGETLELVGLAEVARRRVGKFSLGMRQRLQLATALLGDPEILILDEPANGLDLQWLRSFIRNQAELGHAVLVSSHLLAEVEETVDDIVIISEGRLVLQSTLADMASRTAAGTGMRVRTPEIDRLGTALDAVPAGWRRTGPDTLVIDGATPEWFGHFAAEHRIVLYELVQERSSLEDVFLELTTALATPGFTPGGGQPAPFPTGGPS